MNFWRGDLYLTNDVGLDHFFQGQVSEIEGVAQVVFFQQVLGGGEVFVAAFGPVVHLFLGVHCGLIIVENIIRCKGEDFEGVMGYCCRWGCGVFGTSLASGGVW